MTSALYLVLSLIVMWGLATAVGILSANHFQPEALDINTFLMMNLGVFLYHWAISSICFLFLLHIQYFKKLFDLWCWDPVTAFFVISLLIKISEDLEFLKYFTLNTLFDTEKKFWKEAVTSKTFKA